MFKGDEPLARREHLDVLLDLMERDAAEVGTLKTPCSPEDVSNPNAVKVVAARDGRALYFSRATIPFDRDRRGMCVTTSTWASMPIARPRWMPSAPGQSQDWNARSGWSNCGFSTTVSAVHVAETPFDTVGVDTEEDLRRVEAILRART